MIRFKWYRSGDLFGMRYDFEHGDALPTHSHDRLNEHNVIVLEGMVCLEMPDGHKKYGSRGDVIDFDGGQLHTIRCLSRYATTLNMWLRGIPEGYDALPASEHEGVL
jgi:quercetin dioxygenase-like cupin family protein